MNLYVHVTDEYKQDEMIKLESFLLQKSKNPNAVSSAGEWGKNGV